MIKALKNIIKKAHGTTLIEFLIYMGIFSILLLIFVQIFSIILDNQQESMSTTSVSQDGECIINRLAYDIGRTQSVTSPALLGVSGNTLNLTINGINFQYGLNNANLVLNNDLLNGFNTSVSNLTFTRLGAQGAKDTIISRFTLTSKTKQQKGPEIKTFQITVGLR